MGTLIGPLVSSGLAAKAIEYRIDPEHTYPSFAADHMGISTWRGKLDRTTGTIELDRAAGRGTVDVEIDLSSIDFGLGKLNDWAKSDKFFDVAKYPHAHYRGRLAGFRDGAPSRVEGELDLHGVTRPLVLAIDAFRCVPHPLLKRELCGANAVGTIRRDEFGLDEGKSYHFDMAVALQIQVEAIAVQ
jgi:polyisoprenoid-binding protein YceI